MATQLEGRLLWEPSPEAAGSSRIARYMEWLESERGLAFADYHELWRWSTTDIEAFWASIWDYFDVRSSTSYSSVLASRDMPGAQWFVGAELNYAEHVFRDRRPDDVAVIQASEVRPQSEITWRELHDQVASAAAGLRRLGVARGDRVVAYVPNVPEALVALLACASIGAVWSSCSPDFGPASAADRFKQVEPKVLIAANGYRYGGRDFDRLDAVAQLQEAIPTLEQTVVLRYLEGPADISRLSDAVVWDDLMTAETGAELSFEPVPFDHPLWVLYSSGTTGLPKAIVHSQGGMLLEHLKKLALHVDLDEGDRFFWFTTTGWMMWNFLVSGLLTGATIVMYDGNPGHPDMNTLWKLAESTGMTCFGTSTGYLTACMKAGIDPGRDHDLTRLRSIGSTGSPLPPDGFDWAYERVKDDLWLFSTSGGSDLCTAFVGGCPLLPVHAGELQCRSLGASVEAWDEQGRSLVDEVGELVITEPMPCMPIYLWNDPDGQRYREAYFDMYPGVWRHGDWIKITPRGSCVIYGRSDSTINRGGVRIGTSEIYTAVERVPAVTNSLVIDLPTGGAESSVLLFVVLAEGAELDDDIKAEIKRRIREDCSPRHVPNEIIAIPAVPETLTGKKLEVPVKKILMGTPVERAASPGSMKNPESLDYFVDYAQRTAATAT